MKIISEAKAHGGRQGVYSMESEACGCDMNFAVFLPIQAKEQLCPVVWFLSGLTCTHANVMDKGEYRRMASEFGLIIVWFSLQGWLPQFERLAHEFLGLAGQWLR